MALSVVLVIMVIVGQNHATPLPPSAKTMGTPIQYVPTGQTPTKASSARKTVLQDIKKQGHSIILANNARKADFQTRETSINVNRGQTATKAQGWLAMVLELRTASAIAVPVEPLANMTT